MPDQNIDDKKASFLERALDEGRRAFVAPEKKLN